MSPRTEDQNRLIRDERREQILQAALGVFARKGLATTKIGDIAIAAGLSHGLVYHYFSSKDEIFTALVDQALMGASMVARAAAERTGTPWERLRWLTTMLLTHTSPSADYFLLMLQAFTSESVPDAAKRLVTEKGPLPHQLTMPLIEAGQADGSVVAGDAAKLTVAYYAMMQGLSLSQIQGREVHGFPDPDVEMVLRLLKA